MKRQSYVSLLTALALATACSILLYTNYMDSRYNRERLRPNEGRGIQSALLNITGGYDGHFPHAADTARVARVPKSAGVVQTGDSNDAHEVNRMSLPTDEFNFAHDTTREHVLGINETGVPQGATCHLRMPRTLAAGGQFHLLDDGFSYVYAAYYDDRQSDIKITGLVNGSVGLFCQIWTRESTDVYVVPAGQIMIQNRQRSSVILTCAWAQPTRPYAVSLSTKRCVLGNVTLSVFNGEPALQPRRNFTVCVKPVLDQNDDTGIRLVEMIENNRVFGADHFFIYNMTFDDFPLKSTTARVFRYYMDQGLATLLQWPWPQPPNLQHPVFNGQVLATTDCLYRNLWVSKYIIHLDMDEVLVARKPETWHGLVSDYNSEPLCAVVFRNVFFFTTRESDTTFLHYPDVNSSKYTIYSLLKTTRNRKVWEFRRRAKYIGLTKSLILQQVHEPVCIRGSNTVYLPTDAGLLHHYRQQNIFEAVKDSPVVDREMHKYNETIRTRMRKAMISVGVV